MFVECEGEKDTERTRVMAPASPEDASRDCVFESAKSAPPARCEACAARAPRCPEWCPSDRISRCTCEGGAPVVRTFDRSGQTTPDLACPHTRVCCPFDLTECIY